MFVDRSQSASEVVVYSATDLAAAASCEYALLRRFDVKLGRGHGVATPDDEMLRRTAELGSEHERRTLEALLAKYGDQVICVPSAAFSVPALRRAAEATLAAFAKRPEVVYQAAVFDGRFAGFADFVMRDGKHYQVVDTKLARHAKITALLQIAGYADALQIIGIPMAPTARLVLGDGKEAEYPIADLIPVYHRQRARLQELLDSHLARGPVRWHPEPGAPDISACMRCEYCVPELIADDDLLLVAGMRISQRAVLAESGITTLAELAESTEPVDGMSASTLSGLRTQAQLQLTERTTAQPQVQIINADGLGALPAANPGDLFFDFEGDPLWTEDGQTWGLEYLWGILDARDKFTPLWAHDRPAERKALEKFLSLVRNRRQRYPGMHIYHYAAYERTALLALAIRYGIGEDEVDDLLRNEVLVDLYPIVRNSLRVGASSYSLKKLEPLYMGTDLRTGDVTTASSSITEYERYRTLHDAGRKAQEDAAQRVLADIADYNHYDCRSTRKLRDWLQNKAFEAGVTHLTRPPQQSESIALHDDTAHTLLQFAGDGFSAPRTPEQTAAALLNCARGYHQRERKPFWWGHFHRLNHPVDEWGDTSGVFLVESAAVEREWHLPPRARKPRRHVRLLGVLQGGVLDHSPQVLYDRPAPPGLDDEHPDRRAAGNSKVLEVNDIDGVPVDILIEELEPAGGPFDQLPMALTPAKPILAGKIEESIAALADRAADTLRAEPPALPRCAVVDLLCRRPPTTRDGSGLPRGDDNIATITAAVLNLDRSYLAVHGPPGTGKTFTAARVIAALVNEHNWKVGVVAQSHAVVAHLLDEIVNAGVDRSRVAKKAGPNEPAGQFDTISEAAYTTFLDRADGCVIGGTAWDFANPGRVGEEQLDLLAIDEAGQFSLGNTIAVARAARSLLLLGDPQQLGQVSTGSHPEPVDASALGALMAGHDVLPAEFGYFLERTHRMHPAVCEVVSALSYDGRLVPHPKTASRELAGQPAGVHTLLVDHEDNSTASVEEADAIATAITSMIGSAWTDEHGTRPLTAADVLVVAPYNAQVLTLSTRFAQSGLDDVLVGTVDRLQGRQAPVVFVSMTASALEDIPRGMTFLLNRNRLNVAISRAQYLAVVVRSPRLTEYLPGTPQGMLDLGAFLRVSPD